MLASPALITARREAAGGTFNERFCCWGTDQSRFGAPFGGELNMARQSRVVLRLYRGANIRYQAHSASHALALFSAERAALKGTAERPRVGRQDNKGYK